MQPFPFFPFFSFKTLLVFKPLAAKTLFKSPADALLSPSGGGSGAGTSRWQLQNYPEGSKGTFFIKKTTFSVQVLQSGSSQLN